MADRLFLIAFLLLLNGFFVAAEFALVRSRRSRLETMVQQGNWRSRLALRAAENLPRVLSANQIGVTLCSLAIGALSENALSEYFGDWLARLPMAIDLSMRMGLGAGIALTVVAYFQVVFSELVPRAAALRHPEEVAGWLTPPLLLFAWLVMPFAWVLNRSAYLVFDHLDTPCIQARRMCIPRAAPAGGTEPGGEGCSRPKMRILLKGV